MLLVQDQYGQNNRKNFDTELQCKQNTSKQLFSDAKETWDIESGCEEVLTSGNDSAGEDILFADPSEIPEDIVEPRRQINSRKKNVRFGSFDYNYVGVFDTSETSSVENDYLGKGCEYFEPGRRRFLTQNHEIAGYKNHYRVSHKPKWRPQDCGYMKSSHVKTVEERPMGASEYDTRRMRRKEHHCGRHHYENFDDVTYKKPYQRSFKFECGDDITGRCCDRWAEKNNYLKMKPMISSSSKHVCHVMDSDPDAANHRKYRPNHYDPQMPYYCSEGFYEQPYSTKIKKKVLEPLQEQMEHLSDSTYKIPCSKFSNQTISGELSVFPRKKSTEKLTNASLSDWLYYGGKGVGGPPRIHKMRSRRTRMNRIKNGWKKALVQTVRDGSRNERVGLIVMGSRGPEFYAKNSKKSMGVVPFRKSKSFLDGSFEVMTVDCKNVFLSSSEPASRTNYTINDIISPEDDDKVEEKIARFSKNVNEIVKNSEEKFYKSLSPLEYQQKSQTTDKNLKDRREDFQEEEKNTDEKADSLQKFSPSRMLPYENLSPRMCGNQGKKISENSKAMADALNEQAKQYKENQSDLKIKEDTFLEELKELKEKYLPTEKGEESVVPNLSIWSVKLDQLSERTDTEKKEVKSCQNHGENKIEKKGKDEVSQEGSVKSTEQINLNKQRRKKYYESTTGGGKGEDESELMRSKPQSCILTPKRTSRTKWESPFGEQKTIEEVNSNLISAVFRDLVENGCAISQEESENLQNLFHRVSHNSDKCSNGVRSSSSSSDVINTLGEGKLNVSPRSPTSAGDRKGSKLMEKEEKKAKTKDFYKKESDGINEEESENLLEGVNCQKVLKIRNFLDKKILDLKSSRKMQGKLKKKIHLDDKMKILRKALPRSSISSSIAAENEATHLKQLKKYIDRFIDRVEASTASEFSKRKEARVKSKGSHSTDSSEVQVDAQKILDFVSNPFKKISSDVTINIAKKLTDALVQDKATRAQKNLFSSVKARKHSENETDEEGLLPARAGASSGSEQYDNPEPIYLKQLKKMRNEHINNILLEVKRLSELLRFLDRCNRLHF